MGAWSNFVNWLSKGGSEESYSLEQAVAIETSRADSALDLKLLTMASAVSYLAEGLAMCSWRTIVSGKEQKAAEYYRLNNQPNPNQSKNEFCSKLLYELAWKNEAVIFSPPDDGENLFIADTWNVEKHGTQMDIYREVGEANDNRTWDFLASDVMHLKMNWTGLWPLISNVADEYQDMISTAYSGYKNQSGNRGTLEIASQAAGNEEQAKQIRANLQAQFKTFFDNPSSVAILHSGYKYTPVASANRNTSEINDVAALTDEFAERIGLALHVPVALLKGNTENTEHARADLVMYGIKPIAQLFEQEYNTKVIGRNRFLRGSRLYIDPLPIQLANTETLANFCERMTSCGQYSVDELRELRGETLLGTEAASEHYITKNYGELGAESTGNQNGGDSNDDQTTDTSETG